MAERIPKIAPRPDLGGILGLPKITAPCLGCDAPIEYALMRDPLCAPVLWPVGHVYAYQSGHLCGSCADAVSAFLRTRAAAK